MPLRFTVCALLLAVAPIAQASPVTCESALALAARVDDELRTRPLVDAACGALGAEVADPVAALPRPRQSGCLAHAAALESTSPAVQLVLIRSPPPDCPGLAEVLGRPRTRTRLSEMPLTSGYGVRVHPILRRRKLHTGLDLDAEIGDPIGAHAAGEVVFAGRRGGYGLAVEVAHPSGLSTLYAHLSRIDVPVGVIVLSGHQLGLAGSTGMSTGPHLHWEVRKGGRPIDPRPFLSNPGRLTAGGGK